MTDPDPTQTKRPGGPEPSQPPPPSGDPWEEWIGAGGPVRGQNGYPPRGFPDLAPLIALADALRRLVPQELETQVNALVRELLLTIRALIDWYLERLEAADRAPQVEDIPID